MMPIEKSGNGQFQKKRGELEIKMGSMSTSAKKTIHTTASKPIQRGANRPSGNRRKTRMRAVTPKNRKNATRTIQAELDHNNPKLMPPDPPNSPSPSHHTTPIPPSDF